MLIGTHEALVGYLSADNDYSLENANKIMGLFKKMEVDFFFISSILYSILFSSDYQLIHDLVSNFSLKCLLQTFNELIKEFIDKKITPPTFIAFSTLSSLLSAILSDVLPSHNVMLYYLCIYLILLLLFIYSTFLFIFTFQFLSFKKKK
jgi:hypothetical protein